MSVRCPGRLRSRMAYENTRPQPSTSSCMLPHCNRFRGLTGPMIAARLGVTVMVALRDHLIRHERDLAAVGRPAGDVDGPLAAEKPAQDIDLPIGQRHPAQHDILIRRVPDDT